MDLQGLADRAGLVAQVAPQAHQDRRGQLEQVELLALREQLALVGHLDPVDHLAQQELLVLGQVGLVGLVAHQVLVAPQAHQVLQERLVVSRFSSQKITQYCLMHL